MRVYTVCCAGARLDDLTVFGGLEGAPVSVVNNAEQAAELARMFSRRHPGETFYVAEGILTKSYSVDPLPVIVQDV